MTVLVSKGWDQDYALVDRRGRPVHVGQMLRRHGTDWKLRGGRAPHKPSSTGRIWVTRPGVRDQFFPGVLGTMWLPRAKWHRNPLPGGQEEYRGGPPSKFPPLHGGSRIHPEMGPMQLARLKKGWIKLDPAAIGGSGDSIARDAQFVDPQSRATILSAAAEYEALALECDRRYEAGLVDGIEDLEQRVAELEHWLEHALDSLQLLEEESGLLHETQVGLEEQLARMWANYAYAGDYSKGADVGYDLYADYSSGKTREQVLGDHVRGLRYMIASHGGEAAGTDPALYGQLTDEQAIAAARDAYERKAELRRRYKAPGKKRIDPTKLKRKR